MHLETKQLGSVIRSTDLSVMVRWDDGSITTINADMIKLNEEDCPFCFGFEPIKKNTYVLRILKGKICIKKSHDDVINFTCNYCPMCGRKF